jgi:adenine-specific DNA-methyltransferase
MQMKNLTAEDAETKSPDIVAGNIDQLNVLFPEAFNEGKVDFEVLKQLLGGVVDEWEEKYGLNWNGKRRARQLALTPSTGTLRPCPEDSVDWETTQNLMIEGDNLEVLKLLQKSYAGKVKLIYIDPPYNTGKDFVYPDNFQDNIRNYLELTGQLDSNGYKISSNTESSGRFHTDWLNMMYPRLKLAKSLLSDSGAIFISIDDGEAATLKLLCGEIFGEENFVACIAWQKAYSPANDKKGIDAVHDFLLVYRKSDAFQVNLLPRTDKANALYTNPDNDPRGPWKAENSTRGEHRDYAFFPITTPSGREVFPAQGRSWVFTKEDLPKLIAEGLLWFGKDGSSKPSIKSFLSEVKQGLTPTTWWGHEDAGHNDEAKKELKHLLPEGLPFQTPKPTRLIQRAALLATSTGSKDIILDFFAGSGTAGQAIYDLNKKDMGDRRYILIQLPEQTGDTRYSTIAEITKERLRRAAKRIREESPMFAGDLGFRVFKLASSNIRTWEPNRDDLPKTLEESIDHLKTDRTEQDILFELLLKLGLDLTVPIEQKTIAGKAVHNIGAGTLLVCLAEKIAAAEVEPLALGIVAWHKELDPAGETNVVFRDSAFADDVAKTNLTAILQQHGLENVRSL